MKIDAQLETLSTRTLQRLNLALSAGRLLAWELSGDSSVVKISGPGEPGWANALSARNIDFDEAMRRVHEDDRQRVREAFNAAPEEGSVTVVEYRIRTGTGALRWVRNHIMTTGSASNGQPDKSGISRDITLSVRPGHRSSSFSTLLEEHEQTLQHAPLGILTLSTRGKIQTVNEAGLKLAGLDGSRTVGREALRLVHSDDRGDIARAFANLISGELSHAIVPHRLHTGAGNVVYVQTHFALVHDGRGRPAKIIAMVRDMTDQMAREKEMDVHREKLAHVSRLGTMGQMAAGLAHELNQPLSAIATYAQACRRLLDGESLDKEQFRMALDQVVDQAHRAGDVIRRMRSLARGTASMRVRCHMNELLPELLPLLNSEARHAHVEIQTVIADDLPAIVGDPVQIQQVLLNLMRNGVDAMRDVADGDRVLTVSVQETGTGFVRIAVGDSGPGVDADADQHLFEPFFTTKENGMGMGLSISESIAKSHGGKIGYEPSETGGSVFWFTIPTETMRQSA
ncbi:MAG: ATP-binding protein [Pseudomonadota bacterium]